MSTGVKTIGRVHPALVVEVDENDNNEARVMASAAAKVSEDLSVKDAEKS